MGTALLRTVLRVCAAVGLVLALSSPAAPSSAAVTGHPPTSPSWRFTQTATSNTLITVDVVDRTAIWATGGGFQGAVGGAVGS